MTQVLMVCMGNICRSPIAKIVATELARVAGLATQVTFDSAGTHAQHIGERADTRAKTVLEKRGYVLDKKRSRRVVKKDFKEFDLLLAMDRSNLAELKKLCPPEHAYKLRLFLDHQVGMETDEIPDPYYGNLAGFDRVLALCEAAAQYWIKKLS